MDVNNNGRDAFLRTPGYPTHVMRLVDMYLRANTKKRIVDEVRASPTDTIPDVAENSRSKGHKAKGGRVAPYFVAVPQMDDPGPPPPEFAVVPPTPTATNTTPRPSYTSSRQVAVAVTIASYCRIVGQL